MAELWRTRIHRPGLTGSQQVWRSRWLKMWVIPKPKGCAPMPSQLLALVMWSPLLRAGFGGKNEVIIGFDPAGGKGQRSAINVIEPGAD